RANALRCSKSFRTILSCLDKPQSAIPGGLTLSSGLRLTDFSGDSTPSLHALRQGAQSCRCGCHAGK
ncbi:hypothetical protein, partial [Citrobacter sp. UYEF32]|uniref:hypothetical protein n=1 Tax=Citrobacter sp. UYEF32 TaxID=3156347 RepID=UPI00339B4AFE